MDPLSLAASVAGLLSLVGSVVGATYKYGSSVSGASSAQRNLKSELQAMLQALVKLQAVLGNSDGSSPQYPQASAELESFLKDCEKEVKDLQAKLDKMQGGGKIKAAMNHMKWPFAEDDTAKIVQRLARYNGLFQGALGMDTW